MRRHDAGAIPSEGPRSHEAEPPALKIWLVGALVGGAAATWPLAARAQAKRMRQIGVLMGLVANDPEAQSRVVAFENGLQETAHAAVNGSSCDAILSMRGRNGIREPQVVLREPDGLPQ
jgi:hypothetical protein